MMLNLVSCIPLTPLCLFLSVTDSVDREADRINRSQSAPDNGNMGPFSSFHCPLSHKLMLFFSVLSFCHKPSLLPLTSFNPLISSAHMLLQNDEAESQ